MNTYNKKDINTNILLYRESDLQLGKYVHY